MTSETLEKWPKSISFFNLSINSFIYHWIGHFIILLTWLFLYFYVFGYLYDGFVLFFYNWDRLTSIQSSRKITSEESSGIEFGSLEYYLLCGIAGMFSCAVTHTAIVPLDLLKCRIQVDAKKFNGIIGALLTTYNEEGCHSFTRGWLPTALGYSLQGFAKFGFYELFKILYSEVLGEELAYYWRTALYLSAAASAEFIADILLAPMEATKVRMQTHPGAPSDFVECLSMIYKSESIVGFYKGLPPLWMRQIPYTMMKFACFERTIELLYKFVVPKPRSATSEAEQLVVTFLAGYIAGIFCAIVSHPADTVVSKLNQSYGSSVYEVIKTIGFFGLWKGLLPRILMIGTLTALQWFIYDSAKVVLKVPRLPPPQLPSSFTK